jgi:hypothetical protein
MEREKKKMQEKKTKSQVFRRFVFGVCPTLALTLTHCLFSNPDICTIFFQNDIEDDLLEILRHDAMRDAEGTAIQDFVNVLVVSQGTCNHVNNIENATFLCS